MKKYTVAKKTLCSINKKKSFCNGLLLTFFLKPFLSPQGQKKFCCLCLIHCLQNTPYAAETLKASAHFHMVCRNTLVFCTVQK
uniref:Uncharacterized protein n=1 Tax=Anguilla anguilla TaxID=7936 RepID=A0A0E9X089_ANGAN